MMIFHYQYSYYDTRKEGQSGNASQKETNRYVEVESMQVALQCRWSIYKIS